MDLEKFLDTDDLTSLEVGLQDLIERTLDEHNVSGKLMEPRGDNPEGDSKKNSKDSQNRSKLEKVLREMTAKNSLRQ